ncbi:uncharacterized protein [Nothobranchius furzeri]|uniref:LOC107386588-like protein n=1 Tax=Nothobranchius furzeri TaxID=105023 RepID=A0A9D3BFL8_NOTFU|nr:putative LOC107386588-like protein [Nothobranchius furzeri]
MMRSQILFVLSFILWSAAQETSPVTTTSSVSSMSAVTMTTNETTTTKQATTNKNTPVWTTPQPSLLWSFLNMECTNFVCGGLIIACIFFLVTTLVLACKVCQLSRRIRMLIRNDVELVNSSKYWVEKSKSDRIKSKDESNETASLLADQTNQDAVTGATMKNGSKVDEDGQKTEENEEGGASESDKASTEDAAESSSFPNPPDEILYPDAAAAGASSSSEGVMEEPNNQPQRSE